MKLCRDVEGDEYLELVERQTKTRTGATDEARTVPPRIWANDEDPSKCVVATYRFVVSIMKIEIDRYYILEKKKMSK